MSQRIQSKIKPLTELAAILEQHRKSGKKIVQCHGTFDLLHPGHVRHLEAARNQGDVLVVTLTRDRYVRKGPGRPIFNEDLRAETIASFEYVDYVSLVDDYTAVECIRILKPDVYAKGQDYQDRDKDVTGKILDEEEAVRSVNGRLYFSTEITFSSSNLINEFLDIYPPETRDYLRGIAGKYSAGDIVKQLKAMAGLRVLVIGDAIIDEYHYCEMMGSSLKDHLMVNRYLEEEAFAGGSFAVANHVAGLSRDVHLVTVLGGNHSREGFIREHLRPNITGHFYFREDAPTTVKRRFIDRYTNQKLFEVCYLNDRSLPAKCEEDIGSYLAADLPSFDLVLVADFGHGLMSPRLISAVAGKARAFGVVAQANGANAGFNSVTRYDSPDYICINEAEARLALRDKYGDLENLVMTLAQTTKCDNILITRGSRGSLAYSAGHGFHQSPPLASRVIDRVGAGDAFFAFSAPCSMTGMPPETVSLVGNAAGAIACQTVGNQKPVDPTNLFKFIETLLK
ncbi:MAG: adenylyltransferase/cytidyltransferase family protein [Chloroflexi bacterium]|nr:adenylyltransferase/cytidyltransferase family protein [Chloroflexota bacterium]